MLEGKVIKNFNDKQNNLKRYEVRKKFKAEADRYNELYSKGFVEEGKEIKASAEK